MTGESHMLKDFMDAMKPYMSIVFGGGSKGKVLGLGKVAITNDMSLANVMLVQSLQYNLLSVRQLASVGYDTLFGLTSVKVFRRDTLEVAFVGELDGNLYTVDFSKESTYHATCIMAKADKGWLWHRRLAHVGMRNLKDLLKGEHILGLTNISFEKDRVCSACIAGKQHQAKHTPKNVVSTSRPLELLHVDLFGPPSWDSLGGKKYGLAIIDDYSRYTWVFFLKSKDETKATFIDFSKQAQRKYNMAILAIRSDNGSEFKNYTLEEFLSDEGIEHQYSAPYTPPQNGVAERKNRTIVEMARSMLDEYKSPYSFWAEAINTACHASNRLFLRKILMKTPYELLTGHKPNVKYFRVFGCKCFILNKKDRLTKFQYKTIEVIFVGYASNSHAYRVYNKSTGCVVETCDVVFDEFNGSHQEQVDLSYVGNNGDSSQDILAMGIGDLVPIAQVPRDDEVGDEPRGSPPQATPTHQDPIAHDEPIIQEQDPPQSDVVTSPQIDDAEESQENNRDLIHFGEDDELVDGSALDDEPNVVYEPEWVEPLETPASTMPLVARWVEVDKILTRLGQGIVTRSQLMNFCAHFFF